MKIDCGKKEAVKRVTAGELSLGSVFRHAGKVYMVSAYGYTYSGSTAVQYKHFVELTSGDLTLTTAWTDYELLPDAKLVCGDPV